LREYSGWETATSTSCRTQLPFDVGTLTSLCDFRHDRHQLCSVSSSSCSWIARNAWDGQARRSFRPTYHSTCIWSERASDHAQLVEPHTDSVNSTSISCRLVVQLASSTYQLNDLSPGTVGSIYHRPRRAPAAPPTCPPSSPKSSTVHHDPARPPPPSRLRPRGPPSSPKETEKEGAQSALMIASTAPPCHPSRGGRACPRRAGHPPARLRLHERAWTDERMGST